MKKCFKLLFIFLLTISTYSLAATESDYNGWRFIVAPYSWLFGINGSMTIRGNETQISTTPIDTLKLLKDFDFVGQLHMEARKGRWTLLLDPTYFKLTQNASIGPINIQVTPEMAFVDFGIFYTFFKLNIAKNMSPWEAQALVGGRYFHLKLTLDPLRFPILSRTQRFADPIVGGRLIGKITNRLSLILRGDFGGFGISDTKNTWSASAIGSYALNEQSQIALGFRILGINHANGFGTNRFAINTRFWGPVAGLTFTFHKPHHDEL